MNYKFILFDKLTIFYQSVFLVLDLFYIISNNLEFIAHILKYFN